MRFSRIGNRAQPVVHRVFLPRQTAAHDVYGPVCVLCHWPRVVSNIMRGGRLVHEDEQRSHNLHHWNGGRERQYSRLPLVTRFCLLWGG